MPIVQFTKEFMVTGLVCPSHMKRIEYSVMGGPGGLFVECRATPNAVPVWYVRMKNAKGTNIYKRLGTVAELTLPAAKKEAALAKAAHSIAAKQVSEQKPVIREMTLQEFWDDHYAKWAPNVKRSFNRDEQLFRLRLAPRLGHKKLVDIVRADAVVMQNELAKEDLSESSNNHHVKLLRRLLSLSCQWGFLERNVLKGIQLLNGGDSHVEHYLDTDQIKKLIEVLDAHPHLMASWILKCLLSTGMRFSEVTGGRWQEIDLDAGIWRVPAERSKSKKAMVKYLNESAKHVLQMVGTQGKSEYVFPNPKTDKPYTTITRVWYRLRKLAKIPANVRIHDMRHTYASLLVNAGRSLYEVQRLLSHQSPTTTMKYAHLSSKTLQEAAGAASILVPKSQPVATPPAPPPEPAGVVLEQPEAIAIPAASPTAEILQFPKAA
jgi:integrase